MNIADTDNNIQVDPTNVNPEAIKRLTKDLKEAAMTLGPLEVRATVDNYYTNQRSRIRHENQIRAINKYRTETELLKPQNFEDDDDDSEFDLPNTIRHLKFTSTGSFGVKESAFEIHRIDGTWINQSNENESFEDLDTAVEELKLRHLETCDTLLEPHALLSYQLEQYKTLEKEVAKMLLVYANNQPLGRWCLSIKGLAQIITCGLLTHIDITRAEHAGSIHRYAGLVNEPWEKGQKRPWNATLKTLAVFKLGESFVKQQRRGSFYGEMFADRKARLIEQNENLMFKDAAAVGAERVGKKTVAYQYYSKGKLPPAHIHARARRWAVKIFLSHYFEMAHYVEYGRFPARKPYVIEILGHTGYIEPPNKEVLFEALKELG